MTISLSVTKRRASAKEVRNLGRIPAVVYGYGTENASLEVDEKEFRKIYREVGESQLVTLADGQQKWQVLVHEIQKDPLSGRVVHVDFYQPNLKEEVQVAVPLVFEGVAPAEKELGGTLTKNLQEVEVRALPQNLPHEIVVDISSLKTFEDHILIKDLRVPADVQVLKEAEEIVAAVLPPQKVEEELAQAIEENVEAVEKVEKEKKEEDVVEAPAEEKK